MSDDPRTNALAAISIGCAALAAAAGTLAKSARAQPHEWANTSGQPHTTPPLAHSPEALATGSGVFVLESLDESIDL